MKKYYIIGFTLLIAFLLFVYAASAGPDSEVVIGTIGFFGIVALLPLFLYVILAETRHIEEDIEVESLPKSEEVPLAASIPAEQQRIEAYGTRTPGQAEQTKRDSAREVDRGFIEDLRVKQKEKSKDVEKEYEPRTSLLDIPERVNTVPESSSKGDEQPDESPGSRLVDLPDRDEEKPGPEEEGEGQLISGLKNDRAQSEDEEVKGPRKQQESEDEMDDSKED